MPSRLRAWLAKCEFNLGPCGCRLAVTSFEYKAFKQKPPFLPRDCLAVPGRWRSRWWRRCHHGSLQRGWRWWWRWNWHGALEGLVVVLLPLYHFHFKHSVFPTRMPAFNLRFQSLSSRQRRAKEMTPMTRLKIQSSMMKPSERLTRFDLRAYYY